MPVLGETSNRLHASHQKQFASLCACTPFNAPHERKSQKEHRYCGLAHGVEAEGDEGQAEVGQADVQPSANAIWKHCMAHTNFARLAYYSACYACMPAADMHSERCACCHARVAADTSC